MSKNIKNAHRNLAQGFSIHQKQKQKNVSNTYIATLKVNNSIKKATFNKTNTLNTIIKNFSKTSTNKFIPNMFEKFNDNNNEADQLDLYLFYLIKYFPKKFFNLFGLKYRSVSLDTIKNKNLIGKLNNKNIKEKPIAIYKVYLDEKNRNQNTNNKFTPHMIIFVYNDDFFPLLTPTYRNGGQKYRKNVTHVLEHKELP